MDDGSQRFYCIEAIIENIPHVVHICIKKFKSKCCGLKVNIGSQKIIMSKKLTSLMVIAAAGLLSLPIQAQERVFRKVAPNREATVKTTTLLNASGVLEKNMLIQAIEKGEVEKAEFEKMWNDNMAVPTVRNAIEKAEKIDVLPYLNDVSTEEKFKELTVIDVNNDEKTWVFLENAKAAVYKNHKNNTGDDWLITPGIRFEGGQSYDFLVDVKVGSSAYPEKFEVKMVKANGTPTADAISAGTVLVPTTVVSKKEYQTYGKEGFFVEETGYYYIGIHAITEPDHLYLYAKNINVKVSTLTADVPAAPVLEVVAAEKGELKANVKVTAPEKSVTGADLGNNISKIELYRDSALVKTFTGVTKGQVLQFEDVENMTHGKHRYYALPYDAADNKGMKTDVVSLHIGFDIPNLPETMTAGDPQGKIVFNWDFVTTGVNNCYVDPAKIDYKLYTIAFETLWGMPFPVLNQEIETVTNKNSYEYSAINTDEGEQDFKYFGVQTKNEAGTNAAFTGCSILVGKSYELPLIEGLQGGKFQTLWFTDGIVSELGTSSDATDGDGVALNFKMNAESEPGTGFLSTGKLNLNASAHPTLLFDA
ncbi:MAG: choice-of-anchor J domain-containing protein, partial [Prevotellaceae bacterium]|nr:choice-of-anchor J domain-containing protein [Prevotellaceae bacterium]